MLTVEEIRAAVEDGFDDQVKWLQTFVRFASQRGAEAPCQDWVAKEFRARGWPVDRYAIGDADIEGLPGYSPAKGIDYSNAMQVVAALRAPEPKGKSLILQGHVDVVPVGPRALWTKEPYGGEIVDGMLYGRGAADMKAGICAMVFALDALRAKGLVPASDVYVQTVTEEECTGNGALSTLARGYRADACLIPEPTHLQFMRGAIGVVWFKLTVMGLGSHAGGMEKGTNAILSMTGLITALQAYTSTLNERAKALPWFSDITNPVKFNPGMIEGGDWTSSSPSRCTLDCRLAVLPGMTLEAFRAEVEAVIAEAAKGDDFLVTNPPRIDWNGFQAEHFVLEPGSAVEDAFVDAYCAARGHEPEAFILTAVTDARFYGRYYDIPAFCFGPACHQIHGADEHVPLDSLKEATVVIADFIQRWCGVRTITTE